MDPNVSADSTTKLFFPTRLEDLNARTIDIDDKKSAAVHEWVPKLLLLRRKQPALSWHSPSTSADYQRFCLFGPQLIFHFLSSQILARSIDMHGTKSNSSISDCFINISTAFITHFRSPFIAFVVGCLRRPIPAVYRHNSFKFHWGNLSSEIHILGWAVHVSATWFLQQRCNRRSFLATWRWFSSVAGQRSAAAAGVLPAPWIHFSIRSSNLTALLER